MARPRTPTNVLELRNAFKKHPERAKERENEPEVSDPIGDPPEHLHDEVKAAWSELVGQAPRGVLTASDRLAVEMAAFLIVKFRACPMDFAAAEFTRLQGLLATFGMTPADRSRVGVTKKQQQKNPFDELK